ncbi:hypothetical protein M595_2566 [Lyngbya aestuarii BL J]|uniref:Uncharacterized protein n=1 Tax=Lyngbya aestuarii BL J TaxID=1348334 RepID=U7QHU5_9CYAN|nr:hypothetical protein [Lyngbya aestuarii]ERT07453.1 hypothetical protein M595_2566 [Lyngbya aestuarii BL J]
MWVLNRLLKITFLTLVNCYFLSSIAVAQVDERHFTINANTPSYNVLVQKAETLAKQSIKQAFQENSTLESVTIMILGERGGQTVPILRARVTRSQWQANSDISELTRYFPPSESLLGYNEPTSTQSASPSASGSRTRPQPNTQQTRSQPSTSPVPPSPPTQTTSQSTSPQTQPNDSESPNIIRLEPRSTPRRNPQANDPGFRDD